MGETNPAGLHSDSIAHMPASYPTGCAFQAAHKGPRDDGPSVLRPMKLLCYEAEAVVVGASRRVSPTRPPLPLVLAVPGCLGRGMRDCPSSGAPFPCASLFPEGGVMKDRISGPKAWNR